MNIVNGGGVTALTFLGVTFLGVTFLAFLAFLAGGCAAEEEGCCTAEEEEGSSCKSVPGGGLLSDLFEGLGLMVSVLSFRKSTRTDPVGFQVVGLLKFRLFVYWHFTNCFF